MDLEKNLTDDSGKTKDSDFGLWGVASVKDVYSESDHKLDVLGVEASAKYLWVNDGTWRVSVGGGVRYQMLKSEDFNLVQWSPSTRNSRVYKVDGKISTYDADYLMPYASVDVGWQWRSDISFSTGLKYSPLASASTKGNWLLRDFTFNGDFDGDSFEAEFGIDYMLSGLLDGWFVSARYNFLKIETDSSLQFLDGGLDGEQYAEQYSRQSMVPLFVGKVF